ncbi:hypothetical protein BDW59DRAFT_149690 [Aspergillus cavernicola]|uniref:Uncharacterized protein n=1 Tax=Aspergillus cavernicola TaxID=176166 RepID=A0ABR4I307_9EURO
MQCPRINIAYAGMVCTVCTSILASVQSLWVSAFLDGKLRRLPKTEGETMNEVMPHTQFRRPSDERSWFEEP